LRFRSGARSSAGPGDPGVPCGDSGVRPVDSGCAARVIRGVPAGDSAAPMAWPRGSVGVDP
ncbi:hypothetical protein ABZ319_39290, partial [Nocardia sp. NPDC005978]|uniref:hypothetical protein n=1 Tax=Nocardia sp. NPDC005978 TaxID=3156725 RepID=UPI0033A4BEE5